jgi:hypothetical protein
MRPLWSHASPFRRASPWLALCVFGSTQLAAESEIVIAGSPDRGLCTISDLTVGTRTLYVVHAFNAGMVASRFKIEPGPGVTMTYLSETHFFSKTLGNTQDGISVCYGECTTGDQLIASIDYMAYGTSSSCSQMLVVPPTRKLKRQAYRGSDRDICQDMFVTRTSSCGCPNISFRDSWVFSCEPLRLPIIGSPASIGEIAGLVRLGRLSSGDTS